MAVFLGVDGGGTHTSALLLSSDGTILARDETGPSNIGQTGERELSDRLNTLCSGLLEHHEEVYACFGLAGSSAATNNAKLRDILGGIPKLSPENTVLFSDADIALHGAFCGAPGVILIAGTGSICIGKNKRSESCRIGGWGLPSGDPGSGHWIGSQAIAIALKQADGRFPETDLRSAVFEHLAIADLSSFTERVHAQGLSRQQTAALCPIVCDLAAAGDECAVSILSAAARELCALLKASLNQTGCIRPPICLMGGLMQPGSTMRKLVTAQLKPDVSSQQIREPHLSAIGGATLRARELKNSDYSPAFIEHLANQLTALEL